MWKVVYTADEEDPDCGRCDNICESDKLCASICGPEHGWNGYCRTEMIGGDKDGTLI